MRETETYGRKSCFNCIHSIGHRYHGSMQTYEDPGEDGYVESCNADMPEDYLEILQETSSMDDDAEGQIALWCKFYESEKVKCGGCKKEIFACEAQVTFYPDPPVPACSIECMGTVDAIQLEMDEKEQKEIEEYERDKEMFREIEADKIAEAEEFQDDL